MTLSIHERQVLINQHKILEKLSDDKDDKKYHQTMQEVYHSGFEYEYFEYGPSEDVLSKDDCKFVYEVINMYDDLYYGWNSNEDIKNSIEEYKVMFSGFDLNDSREHKFFSYAKFLIEDLGRFHETNDLLKKGRIREINSHGAGPGEDGYKLMLQKFKVHNDVRMKRPDFKFTGEEIQDIVNPYE
ncbi:YfbU family protein [Carnobacterium jeotgali]|uniref:YfbU family protein n=1 Tax=Carnobacterium jeotgali TaxID=545534 RepID=UPI00049377BC|nr:YfbU family protein [Carnobacterium jeotgali]